jgi:hypothetical protein
MARRRVQLSSDDDDEDAERVVERANSANKRLKRLESDVDPTLHSGRDKTSLVGSNRLVYDNTGLDSDDSTQESALDQLQDAFPDRSSETLKAILEMHGGNAEMAASMMVASSAPPLERLQAMFPDRSVKSLKILLRLHGGDLVDTVNKILESEKSSAVDKIESPKTAPNRPRNKRIILSDDESDAEDSVHSDEASASTEEREICDFFNHASEESLRLMTACNADQAKVLVGLRPFRSYQHLEETIQETKGIGMRLIDAYQSTLVANAAVDDLIARCADIAKDLSACIRLWFDDADDSQQFLTTGFGAVDDDVLFVGSKTEVDVIRTQPAIINPELRLKGYQLLGISWLNLLYHKKLSGILADEMVSVFVAAFRLIAIGIGENGASDFVFGRPP